MTEAENALVEALIQDEAILARLRKRGLDHVNVRPLAEGYVQFLKNASLGGPYAEVAILTMWEAHRRSPGYAEFCRLYPDFVVEPPSGVFSTFYPRRYAKLYATVGLEEAHLDDSVWPPSTPPRVLGLTDRQAGFLYLLVIVFSAWLIAEVYRGALGFPILYVVPLFSAFAVARFIIGRGVQQEVPITSETVRLALEEIASAKPLQTYLTGRRRVRGISRGRKFARAA